MKSNETNSTILMNAEELLNELFPNENSRPTVRWLRAQQKARSVPYIKWGRLVRFNPAQVRDALEKKNTIKAI